MGLTGKGRLYTRNDGVMGCKVGFAGFASKYFIRVEVDVVGEPHGCGYSDFALVGWSESVIGGRAERRGQAAAAGKG